MSFIQPVRSTGNKKKVIYFPYAGGFSSSFHQFSNLFSSQYDLFSVEYPGRRETKNPSSTHSFQGLCTLFVNELSKLGESDFYLIGISMGGYIAFKVAQSMETFLKVSPKHLFMLSVMDEQNLMTSLHNSTAWIQQFLDNEILKEDRVFSDYLAELMLHDRTILMTMRLGESYLTHTPLTIVNGQQDNYCHSGESECFWKNRTAHNFQYKTHVGGHLPTPKDLQHLFLNFS